MKQAENEAGPAKPNDQEPVDSDSEVIDHDDRLIRWMLGLAPVKRLQALQEFADGVVSLRHARKISQ